MRSVRQRNLFGIYFIESEKKRSDNTISHFSLVEETVAAARVSFSGSSRLLDVFPLEICSDTNG